MARPIEPTPTLSGDDADRLLADMEKRCSVDEARRRVAAAKIALAEMMRPKVFSGNGTRA